MTASRQLFDNLPAGLPEGVIHRPGAMDAATQTQLLAAVSEIARIAPFAHARTRAGMTSAAMTNCGAAGWWSDSKGYRYEPRRPGTDAPWPPMPPLFLTTVRGIVAQTSWPTFVPDACLINFYGAEAKMGLHQDRDERDLAQPIVTISLGDAADFIIGGFARTGPTLSLRVESGDVLVMGGASRMRFHGVRRIHANTSPLPGCAGRYSLTFRKAL